MFTLAILIAFGKIGLWHFEFLRSLFRFLVGGLLYPRLRFVHSSLSQLNNQSGRHAHPTGKEFKAKNYSLTKSRICEGRFPIEIKCNFILYKNINISFRFSIGKRPIFSTNFIIPILLHELFFQGLK